jgi:hypothetical protein
MIIRLSGGHGLAGLEAEGADIADRTDLGLSTASMSVSYHPPRKIMLAATFQPVQVGG